MWSKLTSANDLIYSYYAPTANQPGLDLAQLEKGIEYPGVQVFGPRFQDQGTYGQEIGRAHV